MNTGHHVSAHFPAEPNCITQANELLEQFARNICLKDKALKELLIVLDELLSNTLKHGLKQGSEKKIELELSLDDKVVNIKYSDDGPEFNPFNTDTADLSLPLEQRQIGGLGITLVIGLTDSQTYKREKNRNLITLTRKYDSIC
jgi:anti-sigma regulatory factor (Ser/Thr protein kinase)